MSNYLPIIISAIVIFTALMWWLLALGSVQKDAASPKDAAPPKAVPAPPVTAAPPPAVKLMDDPKPASKTAPPKAQAPLKAAATKAAPGKVAKKTVAPKLATPKAKAEPKAEVATAPKAAPKTKIVTKPKTTPKLAPKPLVPDNLGLLKGVGPRLTTLLSSLGVTSFQQVANWSAADIAEIDPKLGNFAGRITRDNWVDQARLLASGDIAGFEKKYGALGSEAKG